MKWQIIFYSEKVEQDTFDFPEKELKIAITRKKDIENKI